MPFTAGKSPTQSNLMLVKKKTKWWNEKGLVNPIIAISLLQNSIADKWKMNKRRENRLVEEKRSGCKKFKVIIGRRKSRKTDDAIITEGGKRENLQLLSSPYLSQLLIEFNTHSMHYTCGIVLCNPNGLNTNMVASCHATKRVSSFGFNPLQLVYINSFANN